MCLSVTVNYSCCSTFTHAIISVAEHTFSVEKEMFAQRILDEDCFQTLCAINLDEVPLIKLTELTNRDVFENCYLMS